MASVWVAPVMSDTARSKREVLLVPDPLKRERFPRASTAVAAAISLTPTPGIGPPPST